MFGRKKRPPTTRVLLVGTRGPLVREVYYEGGQPCAEDYLGATMLFPRGEVIGPSFVDKWKHLDGPPLTFRWLSKHDVLRGER